MKRYLIFAAFCGLFSAVYEHFSHGVYSPYMVWLFLFPLLGGAVPLGLLSFPSAPSFPVFSLHAWRSGILTLTAGSCLTGIFEIYGSSSDLVRYYWVVGILFAAAAVISSIISGILAPAAGRKI